ncbi:FUSC family protein [Rhodococcoides kyotonense]|nr:FUSC family protein [Rhodococcus kyotonensis]
MNGLTLPPRPSARRMLFGLPSAGRKWPGGVRAAVAFGIPASIAWLLGHQDAVLLVVAGSFAVIYGEGKPYRARWRVVSTAGAALVTSVFVGASAGTVEVAMVPVLVLSLVAAIAVYVVAALRIGIPGAFFFVLVCAVSSYLPSAHISPTTAAAWAAAGAVTAAVVSMTAMLWSPRAPERQAVAAAVTAVDSYLEDPSARRIAGSRLHAAWKAVYDAGLPGRSPRPALVETLFDAQHRFAAAMRTGDDLEPVSDTLPLDRPSVRYRLARSLDRRSHAVATSVRVFGAAVVAGGSAVALGLPRPDWAVLGAVLVLQQGPDRIHGSYRGLLRLGGTVLGVAVFAGLQLAPVHGAGVILVVMALQFFIEVSVPRNYGLAVVFITPLALTIGTLSHPDFSTGAVVVDRIVETFLGVAVAFAALWGAQRHAFRRALGWSDGRVLELSRRLTQCLSTSRPSDPVCMELRRDLQFELINSALAGAEAAHNDRRWTEARWGRHVEVDRLGYELLAHCAVGSEDVPGVASDDWLTRIDDLDSTRKQHERFDRGRESKPPGR